MPIQQRPHSTMMRRHRILLPLLLLLAVNACNSWSVNRRIVWKQTLEVIASASLISLPSWAASIEDGLAARLAKRDPKELRNRVFNLPPRATLYPEWLCGDWQVDARFNGYLFPSRKISRERLMADGQVPGFQKCSIAAISDVGSDASYRWKVENNGWEDRQANLAAMINAYLGYKAVYEVLYDARANPNRLSIDFVDYRTINAERIELFCNARESDTVEQDGQPVFVCSEYLRQVTFGTGSTPGVPRQVVTNYAHFWTWKRIDDQRITGNVLTAGYLDPSDALYFDEPTLPVTIFSHTLSGVRV